MAALPRFRTVAREHGLAAAEANVIFPSARAFLLQAHDYFVAAKGVSDRSAPLLQYYSLLNLAKFLISLSAPTRLTVREDLHHGLSAPATGTSPREAELQTLRGVFSNLSEILTGEALPPHRIRVSDLLARCADIGIEHALGWNRWLAATTCVLTEVRDEASATAWVRITLFDHIDSRGRATWPLILRPGSYLRQNFIEVSKAGGTDHTREALAVLDSIATVSLKGRTDDHVRAELRRMLRPLCLIVYGDEVRLANGASQRAHGLPHFVRNRPPLPEPVVLLGVAFYLSHVVRYRPFLFEQWQKSADSWIVTTYERSGPPKFVRLALDYAVGRTNVFKAI